MLTNLLRMLCGMLFVGICFALACIEVGLPPNAGWLIAVGLVFACNYLARAIALETS